MIAVLGVLALAWLAVQLLAPGLRSALEAMASGVVVLESRVEPDKATYAAGERVTIASTMAVPPRRWPRLPATRRLVMYTALRASSVFLNTDQGLQPPISQRTFRNDVLPLTLSQFDVAGGIVRVTLSGEIPDYQTSLNLLTSFMRVQTLFGNGEAKLQAVYREVVDHSPRSNLLKTVDTYRTPIFNEEWLLEHRHDRAVRWISRKATCFLHTPLPGKVFLKFSAVSLRQPRHVDILLNGKPQKRFLIDTQETIGSTILELNGNNSLTFNVVDGVRGCEQADGEQPRPNSPCLSIGTFQMTVTPLDALAE